MRTWLYVVIALMVTASALPRTAGAQERVRDSDAQASRLFIRGLTQVQMREYGEAVRTLSQALEAAPGDAAILSALADAHRGTQDYAAALLYAQEAARRQPESSAIALQVARLYEASGDRAQAISAYEALVSAHPQLAAASRELSALLAAAGRYGEAAEVASHALEHPGGSPEDHRRLLDLYTQAEDTSGVARSLRALIELEPHVLSHREALAQLYMRQGRTEAALLLLQDPAVALPDDARAAALDDLTRQMNGETGTEDGRLPANSSGVLPATATADASETASAAPASLRATELESIRAEARLTAERLTAALQQNPRDLELWPRTIYALLQAGMLDEAAHVADEGNLLFPAQPALLLAGAEAAKRQGRLDAAESMLREGLAVLEEDGAEPEQIAEALTRLARLQERRRRHDRADSLYQAALTRAPSHARALAGRAQSSVLRNGSGEEARRHAEQALAAAPDDPVALTAAARVFLRLEDTAAAQQHLDAAFRTGILTPELFELAGDLAMALGAETEAQKFWQEALRLDPNLPGVIEKLK